MPETGLGQSKKTGDEGKAAPAASAAGRGAEGRRRRRRWPPCRAAHPSAPYTSTQCKGDRSPLYLAT